MKIIDKLTGKDSWGKLTGKNIPDWVKKASEKALQTEQRLAIPYNKTAFFYGKTYKYRVFYKMGRSQGQFQPVYFSRLRKKDDK